MALVPRDRRPVWLSLLSGLLFVFSFPKFGHPAFAWIALTPLIVAVALEVGRPPNTTPPGRSAAAKWKPVFSSSGTRTIWLGLSAGAVYFAGTLYWVVIVVDTFGGLGLPVAIVIGALMVASLAIYPALFAWLAGRSVRALGVPGVWLTPFLWVATEWLRSTIGFAFPWALLGTSQARVLPLVQSASVVGVYGLSWLVALVSAAAAAVTLSRRRVHLWGAAAVAGLLVSVVVGRRDASAGQRAAPGRHAVSCRPRAGRCRAGSRSGIPSYRDSILDRHLQLSRQALGLGRQSGDLARVVRTRSISMSTPVLAAPFRRLARPNADAVSDWHRRVRAGAVRRSVLQLGRAAWRGRPDARLVSQDAARAVRRVRPAQARAVLRRPARQGGVGFLAGRRSARVRCRRGTSGQRRHLLRVGLSRGSPAPSCSGAASCLRPSPTTPGSAVPRRPISTSTRAPFGRSRKAGTSCAPPTRASPAPSIRTGACSPRPSLFEPVALAVDVRLLDGRTFYSRFGDLIVWLSLMVVGGIVVVPLVEARPRPLRSSGPLV